MGDAPNFEWRVGDDNLYGSTGGIHIRAKEHFVCKLRKTLFGLKQSPRMWYCRIDLFFINEVFLGAKHIIHCTLNKLISIC